MLVAVICLLALLIRNEVAIPLATSHHDRVGPAEGTVEVMDRIDEGCHVFAHARPDLPWLVLPAGRQKGKAMTIF